MNLYWDLLASLVNRLNPKRLTMYFRQYLIQNLTEYIKAKNLFLRIYRILSMFSHNFFIICYQFINEFTILTLLLSLMIAMNSLVISILRSLYTSHLCRLYSFYYRLWSSQLVLFILAMFDLLATTLYSKFLSIVLLVLLGFTSEVRFIITSSLLSIFPKYSILLLESGSTNIYLSFLSNASKF